MLQATLQWLQENISSQNYSTDSPHHEPHTTHIQQKHPPISSQFNTYLYVWYPRRKQPPGWLINKGIHSYPEKEMFENMVELAKN